ncbi:glycosyltransferase involved in cell wall biosynthesis [Variovorax boronicumulans]|uniref:glycosyltransferase family 4 protein n=1 Tax=Variovorax boronicumulans TaxID=436515 RepID=UPI002781AC5A|nr:glycosyltransferase [Variovorax boronicumulans]MDQ0013663.1 glycosyltransferase involved in cell wall biosynthesis [Variovorax boronicumulans]
MKVLHIITGLNNGGAEAVLARLAMAEQEKGGQHHVISLMNRGIYGDRLEQAGVTVSALYFRSGVVTAAGLMQLFNLVRKIKPDVVQTWMYHADLIGGVIAWLAGVRAIVWGIRHANLDAAHNSSATLRVVRLCARLSGWVPRKIVSCSAEATRLHQAAGYRVDKFVQIPNGYNMERFRPDPCSGTVVRAQLGVAGDAFVLGMVARFDAQKNHRNLVSALGQLKRRGVQFTCLLVGVDMDEANGVLRGWVEEAGIAEDVKLLGPRDDIPAVMNALDVHVLSSLGEAFPNVLAEAMACGTPCVTTDVGDAAVIVAEHGWVVAPKDAGALADGLMQAYGRFVSDEAKWKDLQAACRLHILSNFELEQMCERYRQAWQACIDA